MFDLAEFYAFPRREFVPPAGIEPAIFRLPSEGVHFAGGDNFNYVHTAG